MTGDLTPVMEGGGGWTPPGTPPLQEFLDPPMNTILAAMGINLVKVFTWLKESS